MSVIYVGSGAPTITGATSTVSNANGAVQPFTGVTITDPNPGTLDTLTIAIGGIGGTFGAMSGLSGSGSSYTITGTAAYITSILESIVFTPVAQAPNTSSAANFTLTFTAAEYGQTSYPTTVAQTNLATFANTALANGVNPVGQLYSDANGDLFGTTQNYGGGADGGAVFEIKNNGTFAAPQLASTPTIIYTFQGGSDAANPASGFVADANGDLFATSTKGGANNDGTVYELVKNGSSYSERVVASFGPSDGAPATSLVMDSSGNLFGVTSTGGAHGDGEIFEIVDNGGVYASTPTVLYSFTGGADGADPLGSLLIDGAGDLITTTSAGGTGSYPDGTVFDLAKSGSSYTPTDLIEFNGGGSTDPELAPGSGLVMDAHGDLFGTSEGGGTSGLGTIFEIVNNGSAASPNYASSTTVLYTFTGGTDGGVPVAQLTIDNNGDLIGTTTQHGANNAGTVFELAWNGSSYNTSVNVLAAISDPQSSSNEPNSALTIGAGGNLYGTLSIGSTTTNSAGGGTVFEVAGTYTQTPVTASTTVQDTVPAVAATISGTHIINGTPATTSIHPFNGVTIGDANNGGTDTDTLTITLAGAAGTLSGTGVSGSGSSYTLSGTAATISSELDALAFTPQSQVTGASATTSFTLSDVSSAYSTPTVDTITKVEDYTPYNDFSGGAYSDVLWRGAGGEVYLWNMDGSQIASAGPVTLNGAAVDIGSYWSIAGTGDYTGDGLSEILWRGQGGEVSVWGMNGSQVTSQNELILNGAIADIGSYWTVAGSGDFANNGAEDILWRGAGGEVSLWDMANNQLSSANYVTLNGSVANIGSYWSVAGIADFNGDGDADILWRGAGGEVYLWDMNNNQVASAAQVTSGGSAVSVGNYWSVGAVGDFNGDGHSDVLWRGASGEVDVWDMSNNQITSSGLVTLNGSALSVGSYWTIAGVGNFTGDGHTDILWRGAGGEVSVWELSGQKLISVNEVTSGGSVQDIGAYWSVAKT